MAISQVPGCSPLPDQKAVSSTNAWTGSFQNIQCYDTYKVEAVLNWIAGKTHDGSASAPVPRLFGMNFQAVSVGEKLVEKSLSPTGGYLDATGTPSPSLLGEIQYVDNSICRMVSALEAAGLTDSTLIIVPAKHGQSPIDPNRVLRMPADNSAFQPPSSVLGGVGTSLVGGGLVGQALEDDVSLIWLTNPTQIANSTAKLSAALATTGGGEVFSGPSLDLIFNNPSFDSRTPDIVVAPNVGVTYTGGKAKISEHGGFSNDDRNVMLLVSNIRIPHATVTSQVETRQIASTIVQVLGQNPNLLQAVLHACNVCAWCKSARKSQLAAASLSPRARAADDPGSAHAARTLRPADSRFRGRESEPPDFAAHRTCRATAKHARNMRRACEARSR